MLFQETKKFLFLSPYLMHPDNRDVPNSDSGAFIDNSIHVIDKMWHNFILFTPDYQYFCNHYFGRYLHHMPLRQKAYHHEQAYYKSSPDLYSKEKLEMQKQQMKLVGELFGKETLIKWYYTFPREYTRKYVKRKRR